ncbi:MAG: sigma 54-interacting transcriptional regulator [Eubacterium sp.]
MKDLSIVFDQHLYISILEKLNEAVYLIDAHGVVLYANQAASVLEDLPLDEIISHSVSELAKYTEISEQSAPPSLSALSKGQESINENIEWYTKKGTRANAIISTYPILENEQIIGIISICENIAAMKKRLNLIGNFSRKKMHRLRKSILKNGTIYIFDDIIGQSKNMENTIAIAKRFAARKLPIMLYGETGTGKEMFAQSIHNASPYSRGQFVAINCAAIPETLLESILFGTSKGAFTGAVERPGLFEKAEKGTVFLDEINSMPLALQSKILRTLQEKEVQRVGDHQTRKINCRVLSATNKLPTDAIKDGALREDLFYRLSTGMLFLPPLRDHKDDIPLLVQHFIDKANKESDMIIETTTKMFDTLLHSYYWPGNIRELSNIIESSVNMAQEDDIILDIHHLPPYFKKNFFDEIAVMPNADQIFEHYPLINDHVTTYPIVTPNLPLSKMVGSYEKSILEQCLASSKGNLTHCSKKLGITRQGLMKKVQKYKIDLSLFKTGR